MVNGIKIALLPISAKPYHAGHDSLVRIASTENDMVKLYVSTSDRARHGEIKISGSTMQTIWHDYIEQSLPSNVTIDYGGSPVTKVYKELEDAEAVRSIDTYVIYSDENDILKYTDKNFSKSAPHLFTNGQIERRGIKRSETVQVSGTEMRKLLKDNNMIDFIALLPPTIQKHGKKIFKLLLNKTVTKESLLRKYIKTVMENTT